MWVCPRIDFSVHEILACSQNWEPKALPKPRSFRPGLCSRQVGSHAVAKENSITGPSAQPPHPRLALLVYSRPGIDVPTAQMTMRHRKGLGLWPVMDQGVGWPIKLDSLFA